MVILLNQGNRRAGKHWDEWFPAATCWSPSSGTKHAAAVCEDRGMGFRPRLTVDPELRLCHPLVWEYARGPRFFDSGVENEKLRRKRTDENRMDNLALLSCHSGDN